MSAASLVDRIKRAAAARNRELATEAAIAGAMGLLFTVITFAGVFWISWIFCFFTFSYTYATRVALGVTALFAIVSFWSAWRRVDPNEPLGPMTDADVAREDLAGAFTLASGVPILTRRGTAGAAMLLISGPANLFDAWELWRHRLPNNSILMDRAANLYDRAAKGVPVSQARDDADAVILLRRLQLIKLENQSSSEARIVRTRKELS